MGWRTGTRAGGRKTPTHGLPITGAAMSQAQKNRFYSGVVTASYYGTPIPCRWIYNGGRMVLERVRFGQGRVIVIADCYFFYLLVAFQGEGKLNMLQQMGQQLVI